MYPTGSTAPPDPVESGESGHEQAVGRQPAKAGVSTLTFGRRMKPMRLLSALFLLLVLGAQPSSAQLHLSPLYETGDQLLAAVNERMKEMGHSEFTYDGLVVWLSNQAKVASGSEDISKRTVDFLRKLKDRKKFAIHVRLATWWQDDVNLKEDIYSTDRLRLPSYRLLQLHILHIPWESIDAEGNTMKVNWDTIQIATALNKEKAEHGGRLKGLQP